MRYQHRRLGLEWQHLGGDRWLCTKGMIRSWNKGDMAYFDQYWSKEEWRRIDFETYYEALNEL